MEEGAEVLFKKGITMLRKFGLAALFVAGALLSVHVLGEDENSLIDRIEEDWELVLNEPNPEDESPQILNVISPRDISAGEFFIFELNHNTQPEFVAGGMQLQRWEDDTVQSWTALPDGSKLQTPQERITYTLRLRLLESHLSISVRNGQSQTWGEFGGENFKLFSPTSLTNLNGYRVSNSVEKSRIGYASFRVKKFVLKEVRYYSRGDLVRTDETDRVVHEYQLEGETP